MTKSKAYTVRKKPSETVRKALKEFPDFVQEILAARNIKTHKAAQDFFNQNYDEHVHDPFLLRDMDVAVTRIIKAIDNNEHIAIYSDFDADGIPGGALLHDVFKKIGYERFTNYIPHRDTEGYGFHKEAVDTLLKKEVSLILTVDVGITNGETVAHANTLGVDVIITDHHIPSETVPEAVAVVNPQREDETYPFRFFCGTGVAFKLAQALFIRARELDKEWVKDVPEGWEKWLLDLVAIATVGDMVPLVGENRTLVHYGLTVLHKSRRPGIAALCRKLGIGQAYITEDDIGFSIAPRINAASRMGTPELGFRLLTTVDGAEATGVARELESLNNKRKGSVASITKELKKRFEGNSDGAVLVAGNPNWNPALLGLAANSLVDTYGKTACLWGREGTGSIKGSCRGDGNVNVVDMFNHASHTLVQFGGHEHAGGFSVDADKVHIMEDAFNSAYKELTKGVKLLVPEVDAVLPHASLRETYKILSQFAPFGMGNSKPVFVYKSALVRSLKQFGKEKAHIELHLAADEFENTVRAIAFFKNPQSFSRIPEQDCVVDVLCTIELSRFAGRINLELRIVDIV
ncbi:MAG: single-stranded-DNA-specific exonuclease RecJ [Parcubacteria group bacterium]|nr:single-stranded-DNA-specific exonuclease RecJ [Parcubacteria group bacterium]|tara:strand:+ start:2804 stop:4531 length:1728 start_codon:yes stop_codon:yes gene_type:complete